jgi:hydrogenase expression/formation protein HypC
MCIAVPMRVIGIDGAFGRVEVGGVQRDVGLHLLPDIKTGDYVIVHAGFAIQRLDEEKALEALKLFGEMENMV